MVASATVWAIGLWCWTARAPWSNMPPANRPEDPRLTYAGPYLNIHPDVTYVGDEICAKCHQDKALSYQQHPMGRSLLPVSQIAARQRYNSDTHNPFEALGTQFLVARLGEGVVHRQVGRDKKGQAVYQSDMPIDYVLGSGTRGYSYLTDRDGFVFESPISWFSQKQIWDLSPGFAVAVRAGRPVLAMCLFCHANRARPRDGYINRYEEPVFEGYAIGCERCHGPGARHVEDPGQKDPRTGADYTIVNPRHLEPDLRAAVCEQCHLAGEARVVHRGHSPYDFRPGLPLEAFLSIYVRATKPDAEKQAVNHVEQMYQSRCFVQSSEKPEAGKRKLGCTSCHDPHQHVGAEQRIAYYRQRCLECHGDLGCSVPLETRRLTRPDDSCIDCHMPRYPAADIAHTAATDHRILRHVKKDAPITTRESRREGAIRPFHPPRADLSEQQRERDLGIALAHTMVQDLVQRKAPSPDVAGQALGLLEAAGRNDPEDWQAWEARAEVLALLNRRAEALAAYEAVLARAPNREGSLMGAAMLAHNQQLWEPALAYWRRAVAENPWQPLYRANLGQILADRKAWEEARPQCEAWVRLDPASIEARVLWVRCLLKTGAKAEAEVEFAKIERLQPPNLPVLQARFAVESRGR
jgi:hypothetical protein